MWQYCILWHAICCKIILVMGDSYFKTNSVFFYRINSVSCRTDSVFSLNWFGFFTEPTRFFGLVFFIINKVRTHSRLVSCKRTRSSHMQDYWECNHTKIVAHHTDINDLLLYQCTHDVLLSWCDYILCGLACVELRVSFFAENYSWLWACTLLIMKKKLTQITKSVQWKKLSWFCKKTKSVLVK